MVTKHRARATHSFIFPTDAAHATPRLAEMSTTPVLPRGGRVRTQSPPVRRSSLTRSQSLPPIDPDAERRHLRDGTHASPSFGDATSHAETTAGEDSEHEEGWAFATERAAAVSFSMPATDSEHGELASLRAELLFSSSVESLLPPIGAPTNSGGGAPRSFGPDPADTKSWLRGIVGREGEPMPASRSDALALGQTVDQLLAKVREGAAGAEQGARGREALLENERRVLESGIQELVRQVGTHCAERGLLLDRLCYAYRESFGALPRSHARLASRCVGAPCRAETPLHRALRRTCESKSSLRSTSVRCRRRPDGDVPIHCLTRVEASPDTGMYTTDHILYRK